MDECAVINASPLIFLARGGHLGLLTRLIQQVVVPQPVAAEIQRRGPQDVTVQALQCVPAFTVVPAPEVPVTIERWGLGLGESSVLALASVTSQTVVIMDDLAGRKCAHALGLPVRGTLGLILLAKRRGRCWRIWSAEACTFRVPFSTKRYNVWANRQVQSAAQPADSATGPRPGRNRPPTPCRRWC